VPALKSVDAQARKLGGFPKRDNSLVGNFSMKLVVHSRLLFLRHHAPYAGTDMDPMAPE
jgi:hypothetical protein